VALAKERAARFHHAIRDAIKAGGLVGGADFYLVGFQVRHYKGISKEGSTEEGGDSILSTTRDRVPTKVHAWGSLKGDRVTNEVVPQSKTIMVPSKGRGGEGAY